MAARRTTRTEAPVKAVAYIRVSTGKQAADGYGLDDQRRKVTAFCEAKGWPLVRVYADEGVSTRKRRPEWERLLIDVMADGVTHVVACKLTRVGRSARDLLNTYEMLESKDVALVTIDEGIDTSTPVGRMMRTILAAVAEFERDLVSERTTDALAEAREQGVQLGRRATLPEVVAGRIAAERAAGQTFSAIAAGLNTDGVPTAQGGAKWHPSTVQHVARRLARS